MRGDMFHNKLIKEAEQVFSRFGWQTYTERRFCANGVTTYFDLFATTGTLKVACEIETTRRHVIDNLKKAQAVRMPLWIVVPRKSLLRQVQRLLGDKPVFSGDKPVAVILPDQLEQCLVKSLKPII